MAIPVQEIITRAVDLLLDYDRGDDDARWTDAELIRWINDSRMAILTRKPSACAKIATVALAQGTLQAVPADGVQLLDVINNMGANGLTPGRSIRRTDRQNIDDDDLYWHKATAKAEISQFTYDDRIPKEFFVWPPAVAGTHQGRGRRLLRVGWRGSQPGNDDKLPAVRAAHCRADASPIRAACAGSAGGV